MNAEHHYPDPGTIDPASITELRVATAAIVTRDKDDKVLLQLRADNDLWGLPGGAVERGESIERSLLREVREETGYTVEVLRITGVYSDPAIRMITVYPDNVVHYVVVTCLCRVVSGGPGEAPPDPAETARLDWYDLDDIPEQVVPSHALRLRDYAHARAEGVDGAVLR